MILSAAVSMLVVLSACADGSSITSSTGEPASDASDAPSEATSGPSDTSLSTTTEASEGSAPVSSDQVDPGLKPYIDIAVADLAKRLSIDAANVAVTSATLQVWPDSSLGCPQPDQQYSQVQTDGSLIVLTVDAETYRYHAGGSTTPFLCEPVRKSTPITGLTTP
jgi:hypothetical protein